jgi:hypothetical protein
MERRRIGRPAEKQGLHHLVSACPHDASGCTRLDDEDQSANVFANFLLGALEHELAKGHCEQDNVRVFWDGRLIFKSGMRDQSISKVLHGITLMFAASAQIPDEQKRRIFSAHQSYLGKKATAKRLVTVAAWHDYAITHGKAIWERFPTYSANRIAGEIQGEPPPGVSLPGHRSIADFLRSQKIGVK